MARVTNYARKFFGKRMQKVKVQEDCGEGNIEIERMAEEEGAGGRGYAAMTPTNVQSS